MSTIEDQIRTPIIDQLGMLSLGPEAAFYAPGHKQGKGISPILSNLWGKELFKTDLPELPELDNLFAPTGVIAEAQALAAAAFGASQTWFLVNGSTCGVIAAILATCQPGDKIILPRNIHQSAIAGLIVSGAFPVFLQPEYHSYSDLVLSVTPEAIAEAIQAHPEAKAVLVVYPTYQGVCCDLTKIAQITHEYDIPLLVDEAHGAHLHFHPDLPPDALTQGADLTVQSTHKMLGALTQASMLHIQGKRVKPERINKALQLLQSTSPSYLLLASLDAARQQMAIEGEKLLSNTLTIAHWARKKLQSIPGIVTLEKDDLPSYYQLDPTRLTLLLKGLKLSGLEADTILREQYHVTVELPLDASLTCMISIGNRQADVEKLVQAVQKLARDYPQKLSASTPVLPYHSPIAPLVMTPREAFFAPTQMTSLANSIGEISGELICPYPPGIPVLMPGEKITPEAIAYLQQVIRNGAIVTGCIDESLEAIAIVKLI